MSFSASGSGLCLGESALPFPLYRPVRIWADASSTSPSLCRVVFRRSLSLLEYNLHLFFPSTRRSAISRYARLEAPSPSIEELPDLLHSLVAKMAVHDPDSRGEPDEKGSVSGEASREHSSDWEDVLCKGCFPPLLYSGSALALHLFLLLLLYRRCYISQ